MSQIKITVPTNTPEPLTNDENEGTNNLSKKNTPSRKVTRQRAAMGTDTTQSRAKNRPKRIPVDTQQIVSVQPRPGYHTHVVLDEGDRIERFKEAGYELRFSESEVVGDRRSQDPGKMGSPVERVLNKSSGQRGYVMDIPLEYYNEDQEAKLMRINATERGIKQPRKNQYLVENRTHVTYKE